MVSKSPNWGAKAGLKALRNWSNEVDFGGRQFFRVDSRITYLILQPLDSQSLHLDFVCVENVNAALATDVIIPLPQKGSDSADVPTNCTLTLCFARARF